MTGVVTGRVALMARLVAMDPAERTTLLFSLRGDERRQLLHDWAGWALAGQMAPDTAWRVWMMRAGRGFGKTRAGAEWVMARAQAEPRLRIALVGATIADARRTMVEGESGLLTLAQAAGPTTWLETRGELRFGQAATAFVYSAERPDSLRGPQHHYAWCDELAAWRHGEAAWDNLLMGLRLGDRPRVVVTTTPRPTALVRKVIALRDSTVTGGRTHDNPFLPDSFVTAVEDQYGGTRLGRQELEGELLTDHEGALWTRAMLDACVVDAVPALRRVVVGVDPPASAGGDACGIVAVGLDEEGAAFVLEDATVAGASPAGWAAAVADCAARHGADRVIVEKNQGGDMVEAVLRGAEAALPVRLVHASRGKLARAEPVAALYEQGRVRHVRGLGCLEDELAGMVVGGVYAGPGRSPDRADALVWAVTELCLRGRRGDAAVRGL